MGIKYANNASTTLAAGITNSATSITVATGAGAIFPSLAGSDYFYATLATLSGTVEIVKVTARSGDVMTVTRAQDGTSASAFSAGDMFDLRLVAAALADFPKKSEDNVFAGNNTFTGYTETVVAANTSTAYTINIANGTIQKLTLTGNCTYTFPPATAGQSFVLYQLQDGTGSRTVSWPASVKWPSGTAPTLTSTASKADIFAFTADGTNWLGRTIGQAYL